MKRVLILAAVAACAALSAPRRALDAQTVEKVSVSAEARIFRRPNVDSEVRATVAAGTELEVLERQEGWVAVSTADGTIGWVEASLTTAVAPAAPATTPAAPPTQPRETATPAPPPARRSAVPPPPPARPGATGGAPAGSTRPAATHASERGGLYGQGGWARIALSSTDGVHPGAELAWAKALAPMVEFRNEISTRYRKQGALPGIDALGASGSPGDYATESDPVWDLELGVALDVYLLRPSAELPLGIQVGGFGDWTRYMGSITPSVGEYQAVGYGGEVGGFVRSQKGHLVRLLVQAGKLRYLGESTDVTESLLNFLVGFEPRLGSVQLGTWVGRQNGQRFMKVGLVFP
jgi:hypothetical protein